MKTSTLTAIATVAALACTAPQTNAQKPIDREILGIKLGKTLNVQAMRLLKEQGFSVGTKAMSFREHPEEHPITLTDTITYLNQQWEQEVFNSEADKTVYRICFLQENKTEDQTNTGYKECKAALDADYKGLTTESTDYFTNYSDGKTEVSLWKTTNTSLRLCYQTLVFEEEE